MTHDEPSGTTDPGVDRYIGSFPAEVAARLTAVRETLHTAIPGAGERIAYGIPTVTLGGRSVVHFAAWKHHLAIYPEPETEGEDAERLRAYAAGRGTLQFPHRDELPLALVARIGELLAARSDT